MRIPGGLVALAILNFVFALPSLLMALFIYALATMGLFGQEGPAFSDAPIATKVAFASCIAIAILLVVSGIGYLVRHPFFGRILGNAFVVLALATAAMTLIGFGVSVVGEASLLVTLVVAVCSIYPALTAVLINTTYRPQFTR